MLVEMKFREKDCFGTNLTKISTIGNVVFQSQMSFQMTLIQLKFFTMPTSYFAMRLDVSITLHRQNIFHRVCRSEFFHFCERLWCETLSGNLINRLFHNKCTGDLDICNVMLLKLFSMIGLSYWIFTTMFSHHMLVEMKFREKHCFGANLTKISTIFNVVF